MGKITNALSKYAKERRVNRRSAIPPVRLKESDIRALMQHDRRTGHLLKYDQSSGEVDFASIDSLRSQGTIQRLLESKLIYPSGKLTPRGIRECKRLENEIGHPTIIRPDASDEENQAQAPALEAAVDENSESPEPEKARSAATFDAGPAPVKSPRPATKPQEVSRPRREKVPTIAGTEKPKTAKAVSVAESNRPEPKVQPAPVYSRPGIAAVRYDENAIDPDLVSLLDPQSFEAEQFKILRTNILFPVEGTPPRSILVTSAGPGEGKTFAAANLAISIALNINKHVLLIDGDLRKPEQHTKFGFGRLPGLTDYLTRGVALTSLLVKTKVEKLSLLPAGEPPPNPSELVSSEQMSNLLEEVAGRYQDRIIVIDSPPPTVAAETGVLARQVDGILLVVSYQKTRFEDAADLMDTVGEEKILGSLVNFIDPKATRSYGYRQYGQFGRK